MACAACKTIPPVVVEGYEPKGKYEEIGGLKTCMYFFNVTLRSLLCLFIVSCYFRILLI